MSRGISFNHKKKGHPGELPHHAETGGNHEIHETEEEYIVTKEAFKNRVRKESQWIDVKTANFNGGLL